MLSRVGKAAEVVHFSFLLFALVLLVIVSLPSLDAPRTQGRSSEEDLASVPQHPPRSNGADAETLSGEMDALDARITLQEQMATENRRILDSFNQKVADIQTSAALASQKADQTAKAVDDLSSKAWAIIVGIFIMIGEQIFVHFWRPYVMRGVRPWKE